MECYNPTSCTVPVIKSIVIVRSIQQMNVFSGLCVRSRSDHLPYILHNETGSILRFTTATDEVLEARSMQRKSTAKWYQTAPDASTTFEFPTKRLTIAVCS